MPAPKKKAKPAPRPTTSRREHLNEPSPALVAALRTTLAAPDPSGGATFIQAEDIRGFVRWDQSDAEGHYWIQFRLGGPDHPPIRASFEISNIDDLGGACVREVIALVSVRN